VRAHLVGGVPRAEVEALLPLFENHGLDVSRLFVARDDRYVDFDLKTAGNGALRQAVDNDPGIREREQAMRAAYHAWWENHSPRLARLPETSDPMILRKEYLASFQAALLPVGILDRFKVTGVLATWWDEVRDEIQTISARGFEELVDGWIDLIQDVIEDTETKKTELFDPFEHKLVVNLLPEYLQQIKDCRAEISRLEGEKQAFEQQADDDNEESPEEGEEENTSNYAKVLEARLKDIKSRLKEAKDHSALLAEKEAIETKLSPYVDIVAALKKARKTLKDLSRALLKVLKQKRASLSADECRTLVLGLCREDLERVLCRYVAEHRQEVRAAVENLWNKYGVSLQAIQEERDAAAQLLDGFVKELGYA
jgi:hypothetical protein